MITIDTTSYCSPNYDDRPAGVSIDAIVLHSGEGTKKSDLDELTRPDATPVSAHFYVDKDGTIYQLVPIQKRAWHAGASAYQGRTHWNDFSIGVETDHKEGQVWTKAQREALAALCQYLIPRYKITSRWIVAHRWLAPERKFDPTNWPDDELRAWIAALYVNAPWQTWEATVPGPNGPFHCSTALGNAYRALGGLRVLGYALMDETGDRDTIGRPCTWLRCERAVLKNVAIEGPHLALLNEAVTKGWIK